MAEALFPSFPFPGEEEEETETEDKYYPSVGFDYKAGDFVLDGSNNLVMVSGREAYIQWCIKMVDTERFACLAYSDDLGTEFEDLSELTDWDEIESEIERTITEALEANPATEYVGEFEFEHEGSVCHVTFTVKGAEWAEETISTDIVIS